MAANQPRVRDAELLRMHQALFGVTLRPEADPARLLERLRAGESGLPVSLRWGEEMVVVMLTHLDEQGRVGYFRPQDGDGEETVDAAEMARWFSERDALGYVPE